MFGINRYGGTKSTITVSFTKELGVPIYKLNRFIEVEGTGSVPYLGCVEVKLQIPENKAFNEELLMMVINDSRYGNKKPLQIGTLHNHRAMELAQATDLQLNTNQAWGEVSFHIFLL